MVGILFNVLVIDAFRDFGGVELSGRHLVETLWLPFYTLVDQIIFSLYGVSQGGLYIKFLVVATPWMAKSWLV
jgi:hypothetical protein